MTYYNYNSVWGSSRRPPARSPPGGGRQVREGRDLGRNNRDRDNNYGGGRNRSRSRDSRPPYRGGQQQRGGGRSAPPPGFIRRPERSGATLHNGITSTVQYHYPLQKMMINSPCAHDDDNDAVQPHRFTRSCAEYSILGAAVMATITGTATNLNLITNDAKY